MGFIRDQIILLVMRDEPGQVITAAMDELPDPAAVFACAKSLHDACLERANADPELNLSEAYQGIDTFMREVMRVGEMFEQWACCHVAFNALEDVWPYLLDNQFGAACLEMMGADALAGFDTDDCLQIACKLRLPLRVDGSLPLPVCVEAPNPFVGAKFSRIRIQTIRRELDEDGGIAPFTDDDDPFDENYEQPVFGIYGVWDDGCLEHITDRSTYKEARDLLANLLPEIGFPDEVIAFSQTITPLVGSSSP